MKAFFQVSERKKTSTYFPINAVSSFFSNHQRQLDISIFMCLLLSETRDEKMGELKVQRFSEYIDCFVVRIYTLFCLMMNYVPFFRTF